MDQDAPLFDEAMFAASDSNELSCAAFERLVEGAEDRIDCVLGAGDSADIPALRNWCASLPEHSYGQVFIEVFSPIQIEPLATPPGVGVTWICRELLRENSRPGIGVARCQALATAVEAWLSEWYRPEHRAERHFTMWMGAHGNEIMHDYWLRLERQVTASQR